MQKERERQKEEQVEALKIAMQSGQVCFCWFLFSFATMMKVLFIICVRLKSVGSSDERASSAEGRNGLPVQSWELWGEIE